MTRLYIGKVVGTHGIKGELKINSKIEIQDKIFKPGSKLYFNNLADEYEIESVRFHKDNYLVLLKGFYNINEVLFLNKSKVYVEREDFLNEDDYVIDDLIGFEVVMDEKVMGIIKDYETNNSYATFLVEGEKRFYLPNVENYVTKIDLKNKRVYTKNVGELIL